MTRTIRRGYQIVLAFNRALTEADDWERLNKHLESLPSRGGWDCEVTALEDTHAICRVTIDPDNSKSDHVDTQLIGHQLSRARIKYNKWIKDTFDPVTHKIRTERQNERPDNAPEDLEPRHKRGKAAWVWKWTETFEEHPGKLNFDQYVRTVDAGPDPETWLRDQLESEQHQEAPEIPV